MFRIAVRVSYAHIIHLWLVFLHPFDEWIFKLCKLEFGIACCFNILIGIWHIRYYFGQPLYELERPALKIHILCCRTHICSCKLSAKVSLMLQSISSSISLEIEPYQHLFHQISTKIICKQLIPFRESHDFFEVIPGVLGRSVNFNITEISIKTIRVFRLPFCFSWLCW